MNRDEVSVLVVDDVAAIVEEMIILLNLHNIYAESATNLSEAEAILEQFGNIYVIVCDLRLGKESGLDIIDRVNANEKFAGRSFEYVFVTGDPMQIDHLPDGQRPYVMTKPVRPRELVELLQGLLHR